MPFEVDPGIVFFVMTDESMTAFGDGSWFRLDDCGTRTLSTGELNAASCRLMILRPNWKVVSLVSSNSFLMFFIFVKDV